MKTGLFCIINLRLDKIRNNGVTVLVKAITTITTNNLPYNKIGANFSTLEQSLTANTVITNVSIKENFTMNPKAEMSIRK